MVRAYTDADLIAKVKSLPSFSGIPKNHWILGVRSKEDLPGKFDDKFYEFVGEINTKVLTGTTNPGLVILSHYEKYSELGAAIVKSNEWYYNLWQYGPHKGKMPALLQVGAEIKVYRDGNKNGKSEEIGEVHTGMYGINFHTNTYDWSPQNLKYTVEDIGAWSAACQVPNERQKFAQMMPYYKEALANGVQKFVTYCLIKEF